MFHRADAYEGANVVVPADGAKLRDGDRRGVQRELALGADLGRGSRAGVANDPNVNSMDDLEAHDDQLYISSVTLRDVKWVSKGE